MLAEVHFIVGFFFLLRKEQGFFPVVKYWKHTVTYAQTLKANKKIFDGTGSLGMITATFRLQRNY